MMEEELEFEDTNDLFIGDLILIGETPNSESWKFTPLFKEGDIGEIRVWQIGFDYDNSQLKTVYGILITSKGERGNLITSYYPIVTNKSGRTLQEQSLLEARRRYLDQYKAGYLPQGEELPAELNGKDPMLAKTWRPSWNKGKCKSNETRLKNFPVSVMPKYDGIRALSRCLGGKEIQMRSRKNNMFGAPLTHIKEELLRFLTYLPVNSELDGELYSFDMGFNELSGVIRTEKTKHKKHDMVKYYIFDIIESQRLCWEERYKLLVYAFKNYIKDGNPHNYIRIVQTYNALNEKDIITHHNKFVTNGYEGVIIRKYGCIEMKDACCDGGMDIDELCKKCKRKWNLVIYRSGRTNAMLKYKEFIDEEVTIIGFERGKGTEDGAVEYIVRDPRDNEFKIRPRGSIDERRKLYKKRESLLGLPYTIRYQELSEKGVPRFPVGIAIRNYE